MKEIEAYNPNTKTTEMSPGYYARIIFRPHILRGEYINIGVIISCPVKGLVISKVDNKEKAIGRMKRLSPYFNFNLITLYFDKLYTVLLEQQVNGYMDFELISKEFSKWIIILPPKRYMIEDIQKDIQTLYTYYVEELIAENQILRI